MCLIEILLKDKVEITTKKEYPYISFEEARQKVQKATNNISQSSGILLKQAIDKVPYS